MRARPIFCLALATAACAHPHEAENANHKGSGSQGAPADAGPTSEAAAVQAEPKGAASGSVLPGSGAITGSSGTPLGTSESALLQPGAERQVREKLGLPEHGGSLNQALTKFQRAHDLPATGVLDHATAAALGLNPDETFRKGESH